MNARGFVLLEWLIASALVVVIAGAVFSAVNPVRDVVERSGQGIELAAGARTALDLVVTDVREAGADTMIGSPGSELGKMLPAIAIHSHLGSAAIVAAGAAVRIRRVPLLAAQGRLSASAFAGDNLLRLATDVRCSTGGPGCGFRSGDNGVLLADGAAEVVTIEAILAGAVVLTAPLTRGFPADAVLCRLQTTTYGLRAADDGAEQLVRLTDGGAEQPVLDNVVAFSVVSDDLAPTRIRRVSLRLRVQAAGAEWRGPAGYLFSRGGTASSSRRWLPDLELRADVALRNRKVTP